jgi:hypothetical protein
VPTGNVHEGLTAGFDAVALAPPSALGNPAALDLLVIWPDFVVYSVGRLHDLIGSYQVDPRKCLVPRLQSIGVGTLAPSGAAATMSRENLANSIRTLDDSPSTCAQASACRSRDHWRFSNRLLSTLQTITPSKEVSTASTLVMITVIGPVSALPTPRQPRVS